MGLGHHGTIQSIICNPHPFFQKIPCAPLFHQISPYEYPQPVFLQVCPQSPHSKPSSLPSPQWSKCTPIPLTPSPLKTPLPTGLGARAPQLRSSSAETVRGVLSPPPPSHFPILKPVGTAPKPWSLSALFGRAVSLSSGTVCVFAAKTLQNPQESFRQGSLKINQTT